LAQDAIFSELAEHNPERAAAKRKTPAERRHQIASKLDTARTISDPDVLTLNSISEIEHILHQHNFLDDPINNSGSKLLVHHLLHTRRPVAFLADIRIGTPQMVDNGPIIDLDAGVIYYKPQFYFGRAGRVINRYSLSYFLNKDDQFATWGDEFPGLEYAHPIATIPLPNLLMEDWLEYLHLLSIAGRSTQDELSLLVWRNSDGTFVPYDTRQFKKALKRLGSILAHQKTGHRSITTTLIQNSFDAYYTHFGLSSVDHWHISERAKYNNEMPVRYTLRHLTDLTTAYFEAHNRFLTAIQSASERLHNLPDSPPEQLEQTPLLRLGSWHAIDPKIAKTLAQFFLRPKSVKNSHPGLTPAQQRHNQKVFEAAYLLGLLNGLRDFEPGRLSIKDFDPGGPSLLVTGRGQQRRILPLHPILANRLENLQRTAQRTNFKNRLLWIYDSRCPRVQLSAKVLNNFFSQSCEQLGLPTIDFYSLRHRFRSDLHTAGIPDCELNYLMGHSKSMITNFAHQSLDPIIRKSYITITQNRIDKFGLNEVGQP
jgi:integrase